MERRRKRNDFPDEVRYQVKNEQRKTCADCGVRCQGHVVFEVHHIVPQSMGGSIERANAVGLCDKCHERHDYEALCNGKTFYEVLMEEGREIQATHLAHQAGIPVSLLESPKALQRHLLRPDVPQIIRPQMTHFAPSDNQVFYDRDEDGFSDMFVNGRKKYKAR